jgi:hypothetical protein
LSALAKQGDFAFQEPLAITCHGEILDGYARWQLAQRQGPLTLVCLEYDFTSDEGLRFLLQSHVRSNGLNAFCRILLALDLEPGLREKARSNQRAGGHSKGSSTLTEAETLDVRSEIGAAASASVGNVTKVKQLILAARSEVVEALHTGEISIHRAWQWSKRPSQEQRELLNSYRSKRGVNKTIRTLAKRRRSKRSTLAVDTTSQRLEDLSTLARRLAESVAAGACLVSVEVIDVPGPAIFMTGDLIRAIGWQKELPLA